jgi:superfamily II DNA/RNA helicase
MKKLKMHEVKTIVIDEADQLFVPEHFQTVQQIVKMALSDRQILVFSATVSERTKSLAKDMMNHPLEIEVGRDELPASKVEHVYIKSEARDKVDVLRKLVRQEQMKALAFFKGIDTLIEFEEKLTFKRVEAGSLHSETKKEDRATTIKGFRKGDFPVLLATDVAARGLDIKGLTHVIHIDVPQDADQYVHRSGRTGRSGAEGTVISLVTEREERNLKQIARELQLSLAKKELYMGEIVDEGTKEQSRTAKKPSKKPFNKKKKQKGRM